MQEYPMRHRRRESRAIFKPIPEPPVYRRMATNSPDKPAPHGGKRDPVADGAAEAAIERRAREIATIARRTEISAADREQARADFRARKLPAAINEDADSMQSMSRDPSDPMTNRGRHVPEYGSDDEKAALEHLALEGVEEAQDEQMVAARNAEERSGRAQPKKK